MAAEKLRDLSQLMDVALLDATVAAFYGTGSKEELMPPRGCKLLPKNCVPLVLMYDENEWKGTFNGNYARPSFAKWLWKLFGTDNNLKMYMYFLKIHQISENI